MSRSKLAPPVVAAFSNKMDHKVKANVESAGGKLAFHGNIIAEWRNDRLFIRVNGFDPPSLPAERVSRYAHSVPGRE